MNYEPNTIDWPVGSPVIHDADAKEVRMLMRVIGRLADGRVETRYISEEMCAKHGRKVWHNRQEVLHDPSRFGIDVKGIPHV